jgi:hypothetical protein
MTWKNWAHNPYFTQQRLIRMVVAVVVFLVAGTGLLSRSTAAQVLGADCLRTSIGLIPLSDMGSSDRYFGEEGGLYGEGQNQLSTSSPHWQKAYEATRHIQPRSPSGAIDPVLGRTGFISIGMSNAKMEFGRFESLVNQDKPGSLVLVNGAQPGKLASDWAYPTPEDDPWKFLAQRIQSEGLTPLQIQVVWLKEANSDPKEGVDDFPVYAQKLRDDMAVMVKRVKELYPNVQVIYLSSRIYSGYSLIGLSPEPFAYDGAYSVRWLIQDQMNGGAETGVTYNNAPVLLWGPYMWADGTTVRSDGLTWVCEDFIEDGVHPSDQGELKAAQMMLNFFTNDSLAKTWLTSDGPLPPPTHEVEIFLPLMVRTGQALEAYPTP